MECLDDRDLGEPARRTCSDGQGAAFRGEIILSDELPGSGRGFYYREDDADAYGFLEAQVVDNNTILVHEKYARAERDVVSGYVWNRIKP